MVRKRSLQPSCIIVCVVTFCLYHGLEKKMLIFLIGPKESVDLVYPGGWMSEWMDLDGSER